MLPWGRDDNSSSQARTSYPGRRPPPNAKECARPASSRGTYKNQTSHGNVTQTFVRAPPEQVVVPAPFGKEGDEPPPVPARGRGSTANALTKSLQERNVILGNGNIKTHRASAHLSASGSQGQEPDRISLQKQSISKHAMRHLHADGRNCVTGAGLDVSMEHAASAHLTPSASEGKNLAHLGLRRTPGSSSRRDGADDGAEVPSADGLRNAVLGTGVQTHFASAGLSAAQAWHPRHVQNRVRERKTLPFLETSDKLLVWDGDTAPAVRCEFSAQSLCR